MWPGGPPALGPWLFVLIFLLTVGNPGSLALQATASLRTLETRPLLTTLFLVLRFLMTGVGVAAGLALWLRRTGAVRLAKLALVLLSLETVVRLAVRADLSTPPPGTRLPLALLVLAHNLAWYVYLQRSGRVRVLYGLESQP